MKVLKINEESHSNLNFGPLADAEVLEQWSRSASDQKLCFVTLNLKSGTVTRICKYDTITTQSKNYMFSILQ